MQYGQGDEGGKGNCGRGEGAEEIGRVGFCLLAQSEGHSSIGTQKLPEGAVERDERKNKEKLIHYSYIVMNKSADINITGGFEMHLHF